MLVVEKALVGTAVCGLVACERPPVDLGAVDDEALVGAIRWASPRD